VKRSHGQTWSLGLLTLLILLLAACAPTLSKSAYQIALERYDGLPSAGPDRSAQFERFELDLGVDILKLPSDPELRLLRAQVRLSLYRMLPEGNRNGTPTRATSTPKTEAAMLALGKGVLEDARAAARIAQRNTDPVRLLEARSERLIGELMTVVALWGPRRAAATVAGARNDQQQLIALSYLELAGVHLAQARSLALQPLGAAAEPEDTEAIELRRRQERALKQVIATAQRGLETVLWTQANLLSSLGPDAPIERGSAQVLALTRDLRDKDKGAAVWALFAELLPAGVLDDPDPLWLAGLLSEMTALVQAIDPVGENDAEKRALLIKDRVSQARQALRVALALGFELEPGRMPSLADPDQRAAELVQDLEDSAGLR
jgi:hypothetical protein